MSALSDESLRRLASALARHLLVAALDVLDQEVQLAERLASVLREKHEQQRGEEQTSAPAFLSADAAAKWIGVTPPTIRQWVRAGKLKRYGAGRLLRVRRTDLEQFLEHGEDANVDADDKALAILAKRRRPP